MKKVFLLCFVILLGSCVKAHKKNDLNKYKLKGKVKTIELITFKGIKKFGKTVKGKKYRIGDYKRTFNLQGNRIEENFYNADGSLLYKDIYKYDNKGNNIGLNAYNADGSLSYKYVYKYKSYDKKGNWTKMEEYQNGEIKKYQKEK